MGHVTLDEVFVRNATQRYQFDRLNKAADSLSDPRTSATVFQFHRATPPLAQVKFEDLTPSNSVRKGMASIFADIDGYTNFVDAAIRGGPNEIRKAWRPSTL